jgi:hypothetical protein
MSHDATTRPDHPAEHQSCRTFRFMIWQWCITRATELIEANPDAATFHPETDITSLASLLPLEPDQPGYTRLIQIEVDTDAAMSADLSIPLIVAPLAPERNEDLGWFVIAGWSQVYRALREGRSHLPAYLLTAQAEQAARIPAHHRSP